MVAGVKFSTISPAASFIKKIRPRLGDPKSTVDQKRQLYVSIMFLAPKCKS